MLDLGKLTVLQMESDIGPVESSYAEFSTDALALLTVGLNPERELSHCLITD